MRYMCTLPLFSSVLSYPMQAVAAVEKDGEPAKTVLWAMAPEVMVDQKYAHGPATDIWAVG